MPYLQTKRLALTHEGYWVEATTSLRLKDMVTFAPALGVIRDRGADPTLWTREDLQTVCRLFEGLILKWNLSDADAPPTEATDSSIWPIDVEHIELLDPGDLAVLTEIFGSLTDSTVAAEARAKNGSGSTNGSTESPESSLQQDLSDSPPTLAGSDTSE